MLHKVSLFILTTVYKYANIYLDDGDARTCDVFMRQKLLTFSFDR